MLLSRERFIESSKRPLESARRGMSASYAIGVESRDAVDATVTRAVESGASRASEPQDHGYMYVSSFFDPDGHHFQVFWMDPAPFPTGPS
jgi:predicted lactoylglutathione lyase